MKFSCYSNYLIYSVKRMWRSKSLGFTLVELSIVLVVIGLTIGGIIVGKDMIEAASIRKIGSELQFISVSINTFRVKYDCLPGDCQSATQVFGINSTSCPNGGGTTGTCDGNGDGFINAFSGAGNVEHLYVWQQLSLAKLIPWSFSGSAITGGAGWPSLVVGSNLPASSFNKEIGYVFYSVRSGAGSRSYKKTIEIGADMPVGFNADVLCGAGLTAPQASSLDTKFDDGLPESGKIFAVSGGSTISPYSTIATRSSTVNSNTTCVSSNLYIQSPDSGCTIEYKPDIP